MSNTFDIQPAIDAIATAGDLIEMKTPLTPERQVFDVGDSNALVQGNVDRDLTIKGNQSLLLQGSVAGKPDAPCRIEVNGDVVVTGAVRQTHNHSANIHMAGLVEHSHLIASGDIVIGANVVRSRLAAGDYERRKNRIEEVVRQIEKAREEHEQLERQVHQEEMRMHKACTATRIPLDFNVGKIVLHEPKRIRIDLSSFYLSFSERPEKDGEQPDKNVELTLMDLFAKGIVGVLARANLKYLGNNPAREKIFMQLLKNLRELFLSVHHFETLKNRMSQDEQTIGQLLSDLNAQERTICIQGTTLPGIQLEFILPQAHRLEDGSVDFRHKSAHLKVQEGPGEEHYSLVLQDINGETTTQQHSCADLQDLSFQGYDGQVVWKSLNTRTEETPA